jgi:hypothetical protein
MRPGEAVLDDEWSEVLDHEIELNTDLLARICVALNSAHRTGRTPSSAMLVGVCRWLQRPAMPKAQMLKGLPPGSDTRVREKVSRISRESLLDRESSHAPRRSSSRLLHTLQGPRSRGP